MKDVIKAAKTCREIGIKTGAFYIIGFPGEKKDNMRRTVDFALWLEKEYGAGIHIFIATPSIGTRLYEECKRKGYIREELSSALSPKLDKPVVNRSLKLKISHLST